MSADNGVYILESKDGYRVAYAQAIENLWWDEKQTKEVSHIVPERAKEIFGGSKVFPTKGKAILAALKLSDNYEYLEYGVSIIGYLEDFPIK